MTPWVQSVLYAPAASYSLVDLPTVKDELSIPTSTTGSDPFLSRSITQVSAAIANYCNRAFAVEGLTDTMLWPSGVYVAVPSLFLSRFPIVDIVSVVQTLSSSSTRTLVEGTDFLVNYATGALQRLDTSGKTMGWETYSLAVKYVAGYGVQVAEAGTIPASTAYQVTVSKSKAFAVDGGVTFANGTALVPVASNPSQGQYTVAAGVYSFNSADASKAVTINYAYTSIPSDLAEATLRMTTMRFKQKDRDPMLMSQSQPNLGDQRWWVGTMPGSQGGFPPEIASLLDNYKVPTIA